MSRQKSQAFISSVHRSLFNKQRKHLLATAAIALVAATLPSQGNAQVNEWTGNVDNNFFNAGNWLAGVPDYAAQGYVNNGSAVANVTGQQDSVDLAGVGTKNGQTGTVTMNLSPGLEEGVLSASDLLIGAEGGHGTLTVNMPDPSSQLHILGQTLVIGRSEDSVGHLNLVSTGKNVFPEGPIFTPSGGIGAGYVQAESTHIYIGSDQGEGTLTLDDCVANFSVG